MDLAKNLQRIFAKKKKVNSTLNQCKSRSNTLTKMSGKHNYFCLVYYFVSLELTEKIVTFMFLWNFEGRTMLTVLTDE